MFGLGSSGSAVAIDYMGPIQMAGTHDGQKKSRDKLGRSPTGRMGAFSHDPPLAPKPNVCAEHVIRKVLTIGQGDLVMFA